MRKGEWKTMGTTRTNKLKIDIEHPEETIAYFLDKIREGELVEVVHCANCKHAIWDEVSKSHYCDFTDTSVPADGYCWRGKKQ